MDSHIKGWLADSNYGALMAQLVQPTGTTAVEVKFQASATEPVLVELRAVGAGTAPAVTSVALGLTAVAVGAGAWTLYYLTAPTTLSFTGAAAGAVAIRYAGKGNLAHL